MRISCSYWRIVTFILDIIILLFIIIIAACNQYWHQMDLLYSIMHESQLLCILDSENILSNAIVFCLTEF